MIIKGTVTQPLTPGVSWSPRGGRLEEARVQILHADLAAYETTAQAAGYEYRYEPVGNSPVGVFSYKRPQAAQVDEDLSDTWAVRYITEQRDIWLDDLVVVQMRKITDLTNRARFKGDIDLLIAGNTSRLPDETEAAAGAASVALTVPTILARTGLDSDAEFVAMTNSLVEDLSNGANSQFVSTPALVRSSVRPAFTSLQPVFSYINSLCTTAGLLAYETTIPSNLAAALTGTLSAYYWLMQAPTMEQQEDGRWRYQREYWGVPRIANLLTDRIVTPT
jgi:hypothetical protein